MVAMAVRVRVGRVEIIVLETVNTALLVLRFMVDVIDGHGQTFVHLLLSKLTHAIKEVLGCSCGVLRSVVDAGTGRSGLDPIPQSAY